MNPGAILIFFSAVQYFSNVKIWQVIIILFGTLLSGANVIKQHLYNLLPFYGNNQGNIAL
jgi:hypothetical protein